MRQAVALVIAVSVCALAADAAHEAGLREGARRGLGANVEAAYRAGYETGARSEREAEAWVRGRFAACPCWSQRCPACGETFEPR